MYTHNQALRMYRKYGVRVPVALQPGTITKLAALRNTRSSAGLAELTVTSNPYNVRAPFQSDAEFHAELLQMRTFAHEAQLAAEAHA